MMLHRLPIEVVHRTNSEINHISTGYLHVLRELDVAAAGARRSRICWAVALPSPESEST
jgi:hypothetical protein